MRVKIKLLVSMSCAIVCSSCVVSNTRTNQDMTYEGHPTRIFVIANLDAAGDGVTDAFYRDFNDRLAACGGHAELFKQRIVGQNDALSLDVSADNEYKKRLFDNLNAFAPDAVLTLKVANLGLAGYGQKVSAIVDSKLTDYRQKKNIWAGVSNMALGGMWGSSEMRGKSLSKDLSSKLREARMIPDCPSKTT